jgi:hypothetical protein
MGYQMRDRNNQSETKKRVTFAPETTINVHNRDKQPTLKDPWTMMDPHDIQNTKKTRSLTIGKTIVLPKGLDKLPSQYGSGKYKKRVIHRPKPLYQPPTSVVTQLWDIQLGKRRAEEISTLPLQNTSHHTNEFAYLAVKTAHKRAEQRRLLRKQRQEQEMNQVAAEMEFHQTPEVVQEIGFDDAADDGDEDQFGADFDFGGGDEDHDNALETNTGITLVDEVYPNRELGTLCIL